MSALGFTTDRCILIASILWGLTGAGLGGMAHPAQTGAVTTGGKGVLVGVGAGGAFEGGVSFLVTVKGVGRRREGGAG